MVMTTTNPMIQHTFPTQAGWRDVKLLVAGAGTWDDREVRIVPPGRADRLLPDVLPGARLRRRSRCRPSSGAAADPCGVLTPTSRPR